MKRNLKLFLLLGLFLLFWFVNFSSAWSDLVSLIYASSTSQGYCDYNAFSTLWWDYYLEDYSNPCPNQLKVNYVKYTLWSILPERVSNIPRCQVGMEIPLSSCPVYKLMKDSPLIPWNTSSISPAIDWLVSVTWEFIPYVLYIWIGVLLFSIWFVAIRRLVNWFSSKIKKIFSSKR